MTKMTKPELIKKLKPLNPLRNDTSWNKSAVKDLQNIYDGAIALKIIKEVEE